MLAVTLGANAAMEFGSSNKALKFYQTVLKFDPDHKEVRKQCVSPAGNKLGRHPCAFHPCAPPAILR